MKIRKIPAMLLTAVLLMTAFAVSALELESAENAVLSEDAVYASVPASYDSALGQLVYFTNFDSTSESTNLADITVAHVGTAVNALNGRYSVAAKRCGTAAGCDDCFNGWSFELIIRPADSNDSGFTYTDGTPILGDLVVVAELCSTKASTFAVYDVFCTQFDGVTKKAYGDGYSRDLKIGDLGNSTEWKKLSTTAVTVTDSTAGFTRVGFSGTGSSANNIHVSSVAVYVKPSNALWLDNGKGVLEYVIASEDTYTFADTYNGKAVAEWTDGTSIYAAGQTVALSEVAGKVFEPAAFAPMYDEYDEELGQLVYFTNFDSKLSHTNYAAVSAAHLDTAVSVCYGRYASATKRCGTALGCGICFNGWSHEMVVTSDNENGFAYADGTPVLGDVTLVADIYSEKGAGFNVFSLYSTTFGDSTSTKYGNGYRSSSVAGNIGAATADWKTIKSETVTVTDETTGFNRIGFSSEQGSANSAYYSAVALYVKPSNALWLTDENGENREYVVVAEDSYTFAAPENTELNAWADNYGNFYNAGTIYALSAVAGKTFKPVYVNEYADYAPENEMTVEMRATSDTAKNGIRFKASIYPSKAKAAKEFGFITARGDVLEALDVELTFDLTAENVENAEGTLFLRGVAYNKADGTNIIYGSNNDGADVYTAVCIGLDIKNKAQITTKIVARPYAILDIDGSEIIVYGESYGASYAEAAAALKAAADNGDENALAAYSRAVYEENGETKNYIDVIIENANS